MELCSQILAEYLSQQDAQVIFPNLQLNATEIVELKCYQALLQIKAVIEDEQLDDQACFQQIEKIVCILEDIGSNGGFRHDFG